MDPLWIFLVGIVTVVGGILVLRLHAFLALLAGALIVSALTPQDALERYARDNNLTSVETQELIHQSVSAKVAGKFGSTCGKIGILIAMASIIGKCLLRSGAADRIVRSLLKIVGEPRAPFAFLSSGFLLGIPVFFDTVFYLLIPLGKAMGMRTGRNYALYVLTIVAGASMAHSLVPPTPGPLFVASELSVDIGYMMLGGLFVGFFSCGSGYLYAVWANRRWPVHIRDSSRISLEELEAVASRPDSELPPLWISLIPIMLPVILIAGNTILSSTYGNVENGNPTDLQASLMAFFQKLGNPNIALVISAVIALVMLALQKDSNRERFKETVQSALSGAGIIILITSVGGAFGGVLQQTGIGNRIQELATTYHLAVLPLAFIVTALVRSAQGSGTVAMITSVGILANMATSEQLGFHPLYIALAIGCGSKPFPWMNDSGFWVVCKLSGFTEGETLKKVSMMISIMGVAGLIVTIVMAKIFPLL